MHVIDAEHLQFPLNFQPAGMLLESTDFSRVSVAYEATASQSATAAFLSLG